MMKRVLNIPLSVRLARFRAAFARKTLDLLLAGRTAVWVALVRGQPVPQREGKIICVRVHFDPRGRPCGLFISWQPFGASIHDIRNVDISSLRYDRGMKAWAFYDS